MLTAYFASAQTLRLEAFAAAAYAFARAGRSGGSRRRSGRCARVRSASDSRRTRLDATRSPARRRHCGSLVAAVPLAAALLLLRA